MEYLHTMVRVGDLDAALDFWCDKLGLVEVRRLDNEKGRYTLVFLAAPNDAERSKETRSPQLELTYNWDEHSYGGGRNFGHLAYRVDDIYAVCQRLMDKGSPSIARPVTATWHSCARLTASPSNSCRRARRSAPRSLGLSMPNTGSW